MIFFTNLVDFLKEKNFIIDIPPAFPSGALHAGHLYQYNLILNYINLIKALGGSLQYELGFDRNGLPIFLKAKKILGDNFNKKELIEKCDALSAKNIADMTNSFKKLGFNTKKIYSTRDAIYKKNIYEVLTKMKDSKKLVEEYKLFRFCEKCKSFLSKNEVSTNSIQVKGFYITFNCKLLGKFTIYTTKPELLGSAKAIVFNPSDTRYKYLKNQSIFNPISNSYIPILTSNRVLKEVGTGIQFVASFGSLIDYDILKELNIPGENHLKEGLLTQGLMKGLNLDNAKIKIIQLLHKFRLEVKTVDIKTMREFHSERSSCNKEIEYLQSEQTFFKVDNNLKKKVLETINLLKKNEEELCYKNLLHKTSENEYNRLSNWIKIYDNWCISRQYMYGNKLNQKGDVLDCWVDSSVSMQYLNNKFSKNKESLIIRFQGSDIVDTWAFFSLVSQELLEKAKLYKIYFTPLVVGNDKKKLSKSSKNYDENFVKNLTTNQEIDILKLWTLSVNTERRNIVLDPITFSFIKKVLLKLKNLIFYFNKFNKNNKKLRKNNKYITQFNILYVKSVNNIFANSSNPLGPLFRYILNFSNKLLHLSDEEFNLSEKENIFKKILALLKLFTKNFQNDIRNYKKRIFSVKYYYLNSFANLKT